MTKFLNDSKIQINFERFFLQQQRLFGSILREALLQRQRLRKSDECSNSKCSMHSPNEAVRFKVMPKFEVERKENGWQKLSLKNKTLLREKMSEGKRNVEHDKEPKYTRTSHRKLRAKITIHTFSMAKHDYCLQPPCIQSREMVCGEFIKSEIDKFWKSLKKTLSKTP